MSSKPMPLGAQRPRDGVVEGGDVDQVEAADQPLVSAKAVREDAFALADGDAGAGGAGHEASEAMRTPAWCISSLKRM